MRRPMLKTLLWTGLFLTGVALIWLFWDPHESPPSATTTFAGAIGLMLILLPPIFAVRAGLVAIGAARLRAGHGELARWQVTADDWNRFRMFDRLRTQEDADAVNDMAVRRRRSGSMVDVIVGRRQLIADGSYHVLRPRGLPELLGASWLAPIGAPECLEFRILYAGRYGSRRMCLRVPVPADARSLGERVLHHYQQLIPPPRDALAYRHPWRVIGGGLAVAAAALAAGLTGGAMLGAGMTGALPILLRGIGLATAVAALIFTAIIAVGVRPWKKG
ncbi:hypothetical protein SAMN06295912_11854 [Sphingomonas laterariae]|uniref:Uncharacterized protein n=1 Tax=Edaphosphingomonas laterariae TaxID=861865 RepID=A0A239HPQ3_9SPHN|nr:hypothetical protein [Sphingomonas laterariae]SNS83282.1 hypothetical protein SAMN06295912_11854 [Sphingomonas laterariae]